MGNYVTYIGRRWKWWNTVIWFNCYLSSRAVPVSNVHRLWPDLKHFLVQPLLRYGKILQTTFRNNSALCQNRSAKNKRSLIIIPIIKTIKKIISIYRVLQRTRVFKRSMDQYVIVSYMYSKITDDSSETHE